MATVVPFASCYARNSISMQPLQLFGTGPGSDYMSLFTYRCPRGGVRPRLAVHAPKMTLRQICRMLRLMRQVRMREAAAAATNARKQVSPVPAPVSPITRTERKCLPACLRRRRSSNKATKRTG